MQKIIFLSHNGCFYCRDVVFVEDVRSVPIGRVLKVDGQYAAVKFPNTNGSDNGKEEADAWHDCRLMKKDDLQVSFLFKFKSKHMHARPAPIYTVFC